MEALVNLAVAGVTHRYEATLSAVVNTIKGKVEGTKTHRGNFLQRLRELVEIERKHRKCSQRRSKHDQPKHQKV